MPKKSKRVNKSRRGTRKVKNGTRSGRNTRSKKSIKNKVPIVMIGCSKTNKHMKQICPNCSGNCYLNRCLKKHKGGSSGCGSSACPIAPLSLDKMNKFVGGCASCGQNGGNCASCQNGGNCASCQNGGGSLAPAPVPGPFIGQQPWGPQTNEWPGVDGISGGRNYLSPVNVVANPQQQMSMADSGYIGKPNSMVGGNKKLKKGGYKKGGGFLPQDFVNLGRESIFNFKGMYNAMNGYKAPIDPSPYKGQLTGNNRIMI